VLDLESDFHAVLSALLDDEWFALKSLEIFFAVELDGDVWSPFNLKRLSNGMRRNEKREWKEHTSSASDWMMQVRGSLGSDRSLPPAVRRDCFHFTIASSSLSMLVLLARARK
jgi:hypothetical protein